MNPSRVTRGRPGSESGLAGVQSESLSLSSFPFNN